MLQTLHLTRGSQRVRTGLELVARYYPLSNDNDLRQVAQGGGLA
jgi:hypothetical protein